MTTMTTRFPEKEAEDTAADSSHSQAVSAVADLVAVLAVAEDLVALAAAEVSAAVELLEVGKILRDKIKVKRAKVRIHL